METLAERKRRRNENVLKRYQELKKFMKFREAVLVVADEFNLQVPTIHKIIYDRSYSNSPLPKSA
mgnify:CR=1 FL=1